MKQVDIHDLVISHRDFRQPLESLATTRYRPSQPRGCMSFGGQGGCDTRTVTQACDVAICGRDIY